MLFPPQAFPAEKGILLFTVLYFLQCKVNLVAVSKKISLVRPNSLFSGVLEVMAGRTVNLFVTALQ